MTSSSSLIKYETPFLVSSTVSNKKLLAELDQNNEESEMFLKKIINTFSIDSTDYSLKDTLNKILPPKKSQNWRPNVGPVCLMQPRY